MCDHVAVRQDRAGGGDPERTRNDDLRIHPQPVPRRLEHRTDSDPRVRALHPGRDRGGDLVDATSLGGARRRPRRRPGHRVLGRAVRHRRRSPLSPHHRPRALLRPRQAADQGALHLGRRARDLGSRRSRCRRRPHRLPPPRGPPLGLRRRGRTGARPRPGDRPLGQLLQPGALRRPDDAALGPADRPGAPADRHPHHRAVPTHVPVRVAVGHRRRDPAGLGRSTVRAPRRTAVRPVRRRLHRRTCLGRGSADRPREPLPRASAERLDQPARVPGGGRVPGAPTATS